MYANQPHQQVSIPADHPVYRPMQIDYNNPPWAPNGHWHPDIQGTALLAICAGLAIEIQNQSPKNPIRMFMYNLLCQNAYQNTDFADLCQFALNYAALQIDSRRVGNVQQVLEQTVPGAVWMYCAAIADRYQQALQPYLVGQIAQELNNAWNDYCGVQQQLQNVMNRLQQRQAPQQQGFGRYQQQPAGMPGAPGGFGAQSQTGVFQQPRNGQSMDNSRTSAFVQRGTQGAPSTTAQPFQARQPVTQELAEPTEQVIAPPTNLTWRPSEQQPFMLAYDPWTHTAEFKLDPVTQNVLQVLQKRPETVKYEDHCLPGTSFGPGTRQEDHNVNAEVMRSFANGIATMVNDEKLPAVEGEVVQHTVHLELNGSVETSLSALLLDAVLRRALLPGDSKDIVIRSGVLADVVVGAAGDEQILQAVAACKTFPDVQNAMRSLRSVTSDAFWQLLNERLTDTVNRALVGNMSIPHVSIESFADDYADLLVALEKRYGASVVMQIVRREQALLEMIFTDSDSALSEEFFKELALRIGADTPEQFGSLQALYTQCSISLADCRAAQLNVELHDNVAVLLTEEHTPMLWLLADRVFGEENWVDVVERHFIRTNDNRVLELFRGFLNQDAYLVKLVH